MKKFCSTVLVIVLSISLCTYANAQTSNTNQQILESFGYSSEIIDAMSQEYRNTIANALVTSPENVQSVSSTLKINILEEILLFLNTSDSEFLNAGVSQEDLSRKRSEISYILSLDDDTAAELLGLTLGEMNILRSYISSGVNQDVEEFLSQSVLPHATISETELNFNITLDNNSFADSIRYDVYITFAWTKPFIIDLFADKIAVSWGGSLFESNISKGNVDYYEFSKPSTWKTFYKYRSMDLTDESPNNHLLLEFPQSLDAISLAKNGTFSFRLTKNNPEGEDTYIIARYGHKILIASGAGVTWGFPGVNFDPSYDQTSIDTGRIKVRY